MKKIKNLIFCLIISLLLCGSCLADVMSDIAVSVDKWSKEYGIEPELIYAIIEQESNFNWTSQFVCVRPYC